MYVMCVFTTNINVSERRVLFEAVGKVFCTIVAEVVVRYLEVRQSFVLAKGLSERLNACWGELCLVENERLQSRGLPDVLGYPFGAGAPDGNAYKERGRKKV